MQNPHHKCDWETRMTTDKKTILIIIIWLIIIMKSHQYKSLLYVAKKCGSVHFD